MYLILKGWSNKQWVNSGCYVYVKHLEISFDIRSFVMLAHLLVVSLRIKAAQETIIRQNVVQAVIIISMAF